MIREIQNATLVTLLALLAGGCRSAQPTESADGSARETTVSSAADLERAPYAPIVRVRDTVSSLGPLSTEPQQVTLSDLVRYHGHPCDGLVVSAAGIAYGLGILFPEGVVDRTDLVAATNASVCYGDVAAYLTGARARYQTLVVDEDLGDSWILCRRSADQCVQIELEPGVKPPELPRLEKQLRGAGCETKMIEQVQRLQQKLSLAVLSSPPEELFSVRHLPSLPVPVGSGRADVSKAQCAPIGP